MSCLRSGRWSCCRSGGLAVGHQRVHVTQVLAVQRDRRGVRVDRVLRGPVGPGEVPLDDARHDRVGAGPVEVIQTHRQPLVAEGVGFPPRTDEQFCISVLKKGLHRVERAPAREDVEHHRCTAVGVGDSGLMVPGAHLVDDIEDTEILERSTDQREVGDGKGLHVQFGDVHARRITRSSAPRTSTRVRLSSRNNVVNCAQWARRPQEWPSQEAFAPYWLHFRRQGHVDAPGRGGVPGCRARRSPCIVLPPGGLCAQTTAANPKPSFRAALSSIWLALNTVLSGQWVIVGPPDVHTLQEVAVLALGAPV